MWSKLKKYQRNSFRKNRRTRAFQTIVDSKLLFAHWLFYTFLYIVCVHCTSAHIIPHITFFRLKHYTIYSISSTSSCVAFFCGLSRFMPWHKVVWVFFSILFIFFALLFAFHFYGEFSFGIATFRMHKFSPLKSGKCRNEKLRRQKK